MENVKFCNGHNVLVQRKNYLSERTFLCLNNFSFKNSMKPDKQFVDFDQLASLVNSVDPDQMASSEAS